MATRLSQAGFVVLALALGATRLGFNVVEATQQTPPAQGATQPQPPSMQDMMKMHEQMMAEMTAGDAKLDTLVQAMNSATGAGKVDAVASVVSELVQQQKAMHTHMGQMHQQMMGGRGMMMK